MCESLHDCLASPVCSPCGSQKRARDVQELELQPEQPVLLPPSHLFSSIFNIHFCCNTPYSCHEHLWTVLSFLFHTQPGVLTNYLLTLYFADKLGLFSEHFFFFFQFCATVFSHREVKSSVVKSLLFLRGWLLCFFFPILTNRNSPCLVSKRELIFSSPWLPASGGLCRVWGLVSALLENALNTESLLICASVRACKQQAV